MKKEKDKKSKKEENSGLLKAAVLGGGGAIGLNYLGNSSGVPKRLFRKYLKHTGFQTFENETDFIKKVIPKDVAAVRGLSKDFERTGPHTFDSSQFEYWLGKERAKEFKSRGKKAAIEVGWGKKAKGGSIATAAHELGHAEHMVGRGSKLGRFAHKAWINYMPEYRAAGAVGGILAGGALSEDSPALAAGIGAATGIAASMPEILAERAANKEGLKLMEKAGLSKEFMKSAKKGYRYQVGTRALQKTLPAAGVGLASGYIMNRLKKHIKNKKKRNTEDE